MIKRDCKTLCCPWHVCAFHPVVPSCTIQLPRFWAHVLRPVARVVRVPLARRALNKTARPIDTSLTLREKTQEKPPATHLQKADLGRNIPKSWESILLGWIRFKLSIVLHSASVEKISGPGLVQVGVGVEGLKEWCIGRIFKWIQQKVSVFSCSYVMVTFFDRTGSTSLH